MSLSPASLSDMLKKLDAVRGIQGADFFGRMACILVQATPEELREAQQVLQDLRNEMSALQTDNVTYHFCRGQVQALFCTTNALLSQAKQQAAQPELTEYERQVWDIVKDSPCQWSVAAVCSMLCVLSKPCVPQTKEALQALVARGWLTQTEDGGVEYYGSQGSPVHAS